MPNVATNDVIKVTAVMSGPSGAIMNVYHFRANTIVSPGDADVMTDLAQKLDDCYTALGQSISSDTAYVEVRGFNITQNAPMPTVPWPTQTVGPGSATGTAAQVAGFALLRTGISRVLGRKYIGGVAAGILDGNGLLTSGAVVELAAFIAELVGSFISANLNVYLPGVPSSTSSAFWAFVSGFASNIPGTQRRRRQGRGI